jgi:hypothetical protein
LDRRALPERQQERREAGIARRNYRLWGFGKKIRGKKIYIDNVTLSVLGF